MENAQQFLIQYGPLVVFAFVLVEQLGLPVPAAPLLLMAGSLVFQGHFNIYIGLLVSVLACLIADTIWFQLGRYRGGRVLGLLCKLSMEPDSCVRRTHVLFTKYGLRGVALAKFFPGLGTLAPPLAGMSGTSYGLFFIADTIGSFLYVGLYIGLGYFFSNQIKMITDALSSIGKGAVLLLLGGFVAYIAFKFWQRQKILRELRTARITVQELRRKQADGENLIIIDLRPGAELKFDPAKIPGAMHVTIEEIDSRLHEIPRDREIVVYCSCPNEVSSARMAMLLHRKGLKQVRPLMGGIDTWREMNYPVEQFVFSEGI